MAAAPTLYQEVILDHNKKPRNFGVVTAANRKSEGHNPVCGDHISLTLKVDGERVSEIAFQGQSCAICKASASLMTTKVKGKTIAEAETLIQEFRDMATGKLDARNQENHLGNLNVFSGVSELPSRVKCAILPWHTLHAAFNSVESATTE